ncbi:MAG TPA: MFS transporter, partial [Acidimicrobiales bacterium]
MSAVEPPVPPRDPRRPFVASPFTRLARTHAFSVGGDALFTVGLAGSVFFSVPFNESRFKVGLYLLLTFAPFAVAAPLIGPVIDRLRGGRRWVIIGSLALRALLCVLIVRDLTHLTFYLEAFLMLVFAKSYLISRAALVPTTVRSDKELVEANSKLSLLSGIAAVAAGGPGLVLLKLGGAQWSVGLAGIVFAIGAVFALRLPKVVVAATPPDAMETAELQSAGIRLAASAMALIRASVGFLVLFLAFAFKSSGAPLWYL